MSVCRMLPNDHHRYRGKPLRMQNQLVFIISSTRLPELCHESIISLDLDSSIMLPSIHDTSAGSDQLLDRDFWMTKPAPTISACGGRTA